VKGPNRAFLQGGFLLIGGNDTGSFPRPGEISLAHNGVLFLDELPEWSRHALEVLREPLESGQVVVARASRSEAFPARFQLVAAMNPCPCTRNMLLSKSPRNKTGWTSGCFGACRTQIPRRSGRG